MKAGAASISRDSLPEQIATLMRKEIFTGVYQPGEKLPSERDLADNFGTARLTLRKALAVLAQEGWIEILQGKNIAVNDFRTRVGFEVLPDLFFTCPEAMIDEEWLETVAENLAFLSEQVLVAAAKKAAPADAGPLLELLARQTDDVTLEAFYENQFALGQEILRIGGNLILQMAYNSQVKLARKLLAMGLVKDRPYPLRPFRKISRAAIKALCSGDVKAVRKMARTFRVGLEEAFKRSLVLPGKEGKPGFRGRAGSGTENML